MTTDHYNHVSQHFNLGRYHKGNRLGSWCEGNEGLIEKIDIKPRPCSKAYDIISVDTDQEDVLFANLPSKT